jgi:hypothetical protein
MKKVCALLCRLLISTGFLLLTGCNPHTSIVLSNDAALKKLNDIVKDRNIRVTTLDSIYTGNNIIINRDSTILETISSKPKVIPYSSMKIINYTTDNPPLNGSIVLKNNEQIEAQNIFISNNDTVIRFYEVSATSVVFPTKSLKKIQTRDHLASTFKGFGYGLLSGVATGAILGTFVGTAENTNSGSSVPYKQGSSDEHQPRSVIWVESTFICGFLGTIAGTLTGAILGQWDDIDITYRFDN